MDLTGQPPAPAGAVASPVQRPGRKHMSPPQPSVLAALHGLGSAKSNRRAAAMTGPAQPVIAVPGGTIPEKISHIWLRIALRDLEYDLEYKHLCLSAPIEY